MERERERWRVNIAFFTRVCAHGDSDRCWESMRTGVEIYERVCARIMLAITPDSTICFRVCQSLENNETQIRSTRLQPTQFRRSHNLPYNMCAGMLGEFHIQHVRMMRFGKTLRANELHEHTPHRASPAARREREGKCLRTHTFNYIFNYAPWHRRTHAHTHTFARNSVWNPTSNPDTLPHATRWLKSITVLSPARWATAPKVIRLHWLHTPPAIEHSARRFGWPSTPNVCVAHPQVHTHTHERTHSVP